jgi:hypothetical protein
MSTNLIIKSSTSSSSEEPASGSSKQLICLKNMNNLNEVFEFAKNDLNSKYLSENIKKNFSSKKKRIKLKELIDEVVTLQQEAIHLDAQTKSHLDETNNNNNNNKKIKTLNNLLSTPTSTSLKFTPPSLFNSNSNQIKSDSTTSNNDETSIRKLNDIIDLIYDQKTDKSLVKLDPNDFIQQLDVKEELLTNKIDKNMQLLQNCILRKQDLSQLDEKFSPDDSIKFKKRINFYSIGNNNNNKNSNESLPPETKHLINNNNIDQNNNVSKYDNKDGKHACEICLFRAKKASIIKTHMKSHNNIRPFVCSCCNSSFKVKGNLVKHLKTQGHLKMCKKS